MKVKDIYNYLDEISPFSLQESWDNSGLLVGSFEHDVTSITLSLDVDEALVEKLEEGSLLITHHPVIFSGIKQLNYATYPTNLLHKMIQKNITYIAMHTNFDQTDLNYYVATQVLQLQPIKQEPFVIYSEVDMHLYDLAALIKEKLSLEHLRVVADSSNIKIQKIALTTGSGASLMKTLDDVDCFLTGDIKYHDAMEAKSLGLSLIDIGHYESEQFFGEILAKHLKNLGLKVIIASSENPFSYL